MNLEPGTLNTLRLFFLDIDAPFSYTQVIGEIVESSLAAKIVTGLKEAGISFVSYLPETRLSQIMPLLREDPSFMVVPVANEAEGVSIAAGASLGGRPAAVYMEGSGVYISSYNLLVLGKRLGVPMLLLVAYYGSILDKRNTFIYAYPGIHLIPILQSLNIQYEVFQNADSLEDKIKGAVKMMHAIKQPVALLFTGEFTA